MKPQFDQGKNLEVTLVVGPFWTEAGITLPASHVPYAYRDALLRALDDAKSYYIH